MSRIVTATQAWDGIDDDRFVSGVGKRFGVESLIGRNRGGTELAHATFDTGSFDRQLARMDGDGLARLGLNVDHEIGIGWVRDVYATYKVLRVVAEVKDSPAGDAVLEAALDGTLRGFSIEANIRRHVEHGRRDGVPVITVTEAELIGIALCPDPADEMALIERVCDQVPEYRVRAEHQDRERVLAGLRPVPRLRAESEYRWGVGFGR